MFKTGWKSLCVAGAARFITLAQTLITHWNVGNTSSGQEDFYNSMRGLSQVFLASASRDDLPRTFLKHMLGSITAFTLAPAVVP